MSIESWIEENVEGRIRYTSGVKKEVHFNCPVCSDTRQRMYVNLDSGKVYCHNCGFSSNFIGLIQQVEGISWTKAQLRFKEFNGKASVPQYVLKDIELRMIQGLYHSNVEKRAVPLPQEAIELSSGLNSVAFKKALNYLESRGVDLPLVKALKLKICLEGAYKNRVIFPIEEEGELKFWVARAFNKSQNLKEKSPTNEAYQISKSEVVFNIDKAAKEYNSIIITEGIFDAISFGGAGVALLGKELYQEQLNVILEYKDLITNGVYIALDNDAINQALKVAEKLSQFFEVYIINIPKELDDPNKAYIKMGKEYMVGLIQNATPYEEFVGIREKLKRLK